MKTAEAVKSFLETQVPPSATSGQVRTFAVGAGMECSSNVDGVIYCSAPAPSRWFFIRAKWLIEFHFAADRLSRIQVSKGLIGP